MSTIKKTIKLKKVVRKVEVKEEIEKVEKVEKVEVNEEIQEAINDTKYCPSCKKNVNKEDFSKNKNKKGGLGSCCKKCKNKQHKILSAKKINIRKNNREVEKINEGEIWKSVQNYELLYECSNLGNIRNIKYKQILKPYENNLGYQEILLCKNSIKKTFKVHRIIALTFIENLQQKATINHISKIRNDNRVCNLEWNTQQEQITHMLKDKKITQYKKKGTSILTNLEGEIWKPIDGYDKFEISNLGRFKYPIKFNSGKIKQRITYGSKHAEYLSGFLRNEKESKTINIHRIVALAFLPNIENKAVVNHIDGNKHNNKLSNLEWVTLSENAKHAVDTNLKLCRKKINQYTINNEFIKTWDSIKYAGEILKINKNTICGVLHNRGKLAGGFIWKYSNDIHKHPIIESKIETSLRNNNPILIENDNSKKSYYSNSKKIKQINIHNNEIIKVWNNIADASFYLTGNKKSSIYRSLKDNSKISLGFKWQYVD